MGNVFPLYREILTDHASAGRIYTPAGVIICDTLEDCDRDLNMDGDLEEGKIYGETAIPYGLYKIVMRSSPSFGRVMPYIDGIKTHKDVMFHWGNFTKNTLGCVLVGERWGSEQIIRSVDTFNKKLIPALAEHLKDSDDLWVQVMKSDKVVDKRSFAIKP